MVKEVLDAERAVLATLHRYGAALDDGLVEEWVDCFMTDGVWSVRPVGATTHGVIERTVVGHDALRDVASGHTHAPETWHKHLVASPVMEIDGGTCSAVTYFIRVDAHSSGAFIRAFGRYRDRLQRCDDGRWRFVERVAEVEGTHPLSRVPEEPGIDPYAMAAIRTLKARYCRLLDTQRWEEWGALFTESAVMQYGPDHGDRVEGRDAIVAHVRAALDGATTVHQATMPEISVDGDRAQGTWAMFDYTETHQGYTDDVAVQGRAGCDGSEPTFAKKGWGHYEETYALGDDLGWRIASLRLTRIRVDRFRGQFDRS